MGSWKGGDKGKSLWEKGLGKKGESAEKGSKGGKTGARRICGKVGHYAKDCSKRVSQVEEQAANGQQNPGGANSSSTTGQKASESSRRASTH